MPETTIAFFRSLLSEDPSLTRVRASLAQALLDDGDPARAAAEATTTIGQDAAVVQAWLVRAAAKKSLRNFASAADDFERAAALAPGRPAILVNLANCHAELGRLDDAVRYLSRAVQLAPECKEAHSDLGSILVRRGDFALAEAPCRAALALDAGLLAAHRNLAAILGSTDPECARAHRDTAYRLQQVFVEEGTAPKRHILVLEAADAANVPLQHLLPLTDNTLIRWYIEYATLGQDRRLPKFDVVLNAIGDPDFAPPVVPPVARVLQAVRGRIINSPLRIAKTRRCDLPRLLSHIDGAIVPLTIRVDKPKTDGRAAIAAAGLAFPVLIRPVGSHGGEGVRRIDDEAGLASIVNRPSYVTAFADFASRDGWYRKYRSIFIDGVVYPYHLAIARNWLVHYWTAGMETDAARRAEERRFLANPAEELGEPAMAALRAIAERLELDFAGIDFALLPDGRILVFEANATMLVHPEHEPLFAYRNEAVKAIQGAFEAMVDRRIAAPVVPPTAWSQAAKHDAEISAAHPFGSG